MTDITPFSSSDNQEATTWKLNMLLDEIDRLKERITTLETT